MSLHVYGLLCSEILKTVVVVVNLLDQKKEEVSSSICLCVFVCANTEIRIICYAYGAYYAFFPG